MSDVTCSETEVYLAAEKLPDVLGDPEKSASTAITQAAFPEYLGRPTAFWEWLEEPVTQPDGSTKPNPSLEQFTSGMVGWGRTTAGPLYQGTSERSTRVPCQSELLSRVSLG